MSRVVAIVDPQTITIDCNGVVANVRLAGIEITDARNAFALLSWTVSDAWVLVENGLVYRSPDGLLVNRELVAKRFAVSTAPETSVAASTRGVYLGEAAPGKAERTTAPRAALSRKTATPPPMRRAARKPMRLMPLLTPSKK